MPGLFKTGQTADVEMPRARRLHLDNVVTSMAELGPTIPDGGYSWLVLLGIVLIQMTVPSILSMYGVVLNYLHSDAEPDTYLWKGSVTLTPILFVAVWSLTDPWSRTIVSLASVPRIVGLIGVALLSIGVLASGYLSTGGVGAYLARLSAGAVMGIGASLVLLQSENLLRRHFRTRLALVLVIKRTALSVGITFVPGYAYILLTYAGLQTGLLLFATVLLPAILGACTFDAPILQRSTPYTLLLSEEDNELNIQDIPDITINHSNDDGTGANSLYEDAEVTREGPPPLFSEANNSYSYEDPEDDVNLFVTPIGRASSTWSEELRMLRHFKFWCAVAAWFGIRGCALSLLVLTPTLALTFGQGFDTLGQCVTLITLTGMGSLLPSAVSYWSPKTARWRSIYFGSMCWLGAMALWGIVISSRHAWFVLWSFLGGISLGGFAVGQENALRDLLGATGANKAHTALSMIVGVTLLLLIFIENFSIFLRVSAVTQFIGGAYWILTPLFGAFQAR